MIAKINQLYKFTSLIIALLLFNNLQAATHYVDQNVTGGLDDGISWINAFDTLQEAITISGIGDTIFVAKGTYYPSQTESGDASDPANRANTFYFDKELQIFGGFDPAIGSVDLLTRDWVNNKTILCGDVDMNGDTLDNVYHIVYTINVSDTFVMDGFCLTGGNANSGYPNDRGGAWYNDGEGSGNSSSPTISNCTFYNNYATSIGGAMYNNGSNHGQSNPDFNNCSFYNNSVVINGGAMYNHGQDGESNVTMNNCYFYNNNAGFRGGVLYNDGDVDGESDPILQNCTFFNNTASTNQGGVMYNNGFQGQCNPTISNCTFYNNSPGAIINNGPQGECNPSIANCIIWGNPIYPTGNILINYDANLRISYSLVNVADCAALNIGGGTCDTTTMIFNQCPLFIDPDNADLSLVNLRLQINSPAIDAGIDSAFFNMDNDTLVAPINDLDGNPRPENAGYDIGAYEFQQALPAPNLASIHYVDSNATAGMNTGADWDNAFLNIQSAIDVSTTGDTIYVAKGTYYPIYGIVGECNLYPRENTFYFNKDLQIFGGFDPLTGSIDMFTRDWVNNKTILCGDVDLNGDTLDNVYHIVYTKNVSDAFVMDGFCLTGGNANSGYPNDRGGAWYNDGEGGGNSSSPTISNCTFYNNYATSIGGAMYNNGSNGGQSNPDFNNCSFYNSSVVGNGGAMYNHGQDGESNVTMNNCYFYNNNAGFRGGVLYNDGDVDGESDPILQNCTFFNNTASTDHGGVMYNNGFQGQCNPTISNCTFYNNSPGAIINNGPQGECNPSIANCIIWGNPIYPTGNILINYDANLRISYSLVNVADCAALNVGGGTCDTTTMIFNQCPLFIDPDNADLSLVNLRIQINSPAIDAGIDSAFFNMDNDTLVAPLSDSDGNPRPLNAGYDMGAYEFQQALPAPNLATIHYVDSNAIAGMNTGADWANAFLNLQSAIDVSTTGDTVYVAKGTYYPIYGIVGECNPYPRENTFYFNKDLQIFGGFDPLIGSIDMFTRDWVNNKTILCGDVDLNGDTLDNVYHIVYTKNVSDAFVMDGFCLTGGNANSGFPNDRGGAWFNDGEGNGNSSSPTISNCTFYNNYSNRYGAMYNDGRNFGLSNPSFSNCTFYNNKTGFAGGAMCNDGSFSGLSNPSLSNCTFYNNIAGYGAAVMNYGYKGVSNPTLNNCTFYNNNALFWGGAIENFGSTNGESNPIINNCTFYSNNAYNGGAIVNNGEIGGESNPLINNCVFYSNQVSNNGGAIYNYGQNGETNPSVSNSVFYNNFAKRGGAILSYTSDGIDNSTYTNCTFYNNTATMEGGVLYNYVVSGASSPAFSNCILWNNTASTGNNFFNVNANPSISNSLVSDADCAALNVGLGIYSISCDANDMIFNEDPLFTDPDNADLSLVDLRLQICSPAIDSGESNSITDDLDGNLRPANLTWDMGAFEFQDPNIYGCDNYLYCEYNPAADCFDTDLCLTLKGCTNPQYCEYDPNAACLDFSCITLLSIDNDCDGIDNSSDCNDFDPAFSNNDCSEDCPYDMIVDQTHINNSGIVNQASNSIILDIGFVIGTKQYLANNEIIIQNGILNPSIQQSILFKGPGCD